jgi:hypothetical protein
MGRFNPLLFNLAMIGTGFLLGAGYGLLVERQPVAIAQTAFPNGNIPAQAIRQTPVYSLTPSERRTFEQIQQTAASQQLDRKPMGEIVQAIASQFLGAPYAAGLLDQSATEKLVLTLNEFDCQLFVETVLAIARGIAVQDTSADTFAQNVVEQRYRNGEMNGYCSRLHYFSEWIADNQKRRIVTDLAPSLGGVPLGGTIDFMTSHRGSYRQLANSDANWQCIKTVEANLNRTIVPTYIPLDQIREQTTELQEGDVVAIATQVPGLDVTHTGLIYRTANGNLGLIHAAPNRGVILSPDLAGYVANVEDSIGILVARPADPRD